MRELKKMSHRPMYIVFLSVIFALLLVDQPEGFEGYSWTKNVSHEFHLSSAPSFRNELRDPELGKKQFLVYISPEIFQLITNSQKLILKIQFNSFDFFQKEKQSQSRAPPFIS